MKPVLDIRRADDTSALFDFKCGVKSMDDFIHDPKDGLAKFIKLRLSNLWIVFEGEKAVKYLIQAKRKEDLFPFKSLHFEALHGDKEGRFSVKANDQYRVEFTLTETEDEPVVTICNIMELSNHYK